MCDEVSGRCVRERLVPWEEDAPGRGVRIVREQSRVWLAMFEPTQSLLLAGYLEEDTPKLQVLDSFRNVRTRRLYLAANAERIGLVWRDDDLRLQLAWRASDVQAPWEFFELSDIPAGENFALYIDSRRAIHLAYQDSAGQLFYATAPRPQGPFQSHLVSARSSPEECPADRRHFGQAGKGVEPQILIREAERVVVYHDADCGALRMARSLDGMEWVERTIDDGSGVLEDGRREVGFTGRFPHLQFDAVGRARIAYHDASRGTLRLAAQTDEGFALSTIDPGLRLDPQSRERKEWVGAFPTFSFQEDGSEIVTYMNSSQGELLLARRESASSPWSRRALQVDGLVGFFARHVLLDGQLVVVAERFDPIESRSELVLWRGTP